MEPAFRGGKMAEAVFTGKFLKPVEAFAVQHFDAIDLNRLTPNILFWIGAVVVVILAIHFLVSTLPDLLRRENPQ